MFLTTDINDVPAGKAPTIEEVWRGLSSSRTFKQMQINLRASPKLRNKTDKLFGLKNIYQIDAKLCDSIYVSADADDSRGCPKYSFGSQMTREDAKRVI